MRGTWIDAKGNMDAPNYLRLDVGFLSLSLLEICQFGVWDLKRVGSGPDSSSKSNPGPYDVRRQ